MCVFLYACETCLHFFKEWYMFGKKKDLYCKYRHQKEMKQQPV